VMTNILMIPLIRTVNYGAETVLVSTLFWWSIDVVKWRSGEIHMQFCLDNLMQDIFAASQEQKLSLLAIQLSYLQLGTITKSSTR
jgi:hypothetical protein